MRFDQSFFTVITVLNVSQIFSWSVNGCQFCPSLSVSRLKGAGDCWLQFSGVCSKLLSLFYVTTLLYRVILNSVTSPWPTRHWTIPLVSGTEGPSPSSLPCTKTEGGLPASWLLRSSMSCRICLITALKSAFWTSKALIFSSAGKSRWSAVPCALIAVCFSLLGNCVGMARPCLWSVTRAWSLVSVNTRIRLSRWASSRSRSWANATDWQI